MPRLQGKVALITGGGGGIGAATAMLFAEEGAGLALVDREGAAAEAAATAIRERFLSCDIMPMAADLSDEAQVTRAVDAASAHFGGLDILVNVAGIRVYGALADADAGSWESILAVNLMATVHCCKAAIPLLRSRGGGSIVNVSSVFGVAGRAGMGQYDVTKAAVVSLSRTMAIEEVGHGIRVNAVCPGPTITPFHIERAKARGVSEEELRRTGAQHTLMKRWAEPREVASTILFLACEESSFVTGTALVVDGGASAAVDGS
ncbi:MAG: SDR family NAD(P)-dependent oxidoreductase [Deltaproteobacteria bacterium]|nr:SDR family NAD(P)-dependent oxidoreductase [Deltaproteobacteria bacterium]